ncbi:MAG: Yip1 family protein [Chloroherpetonaceae bacterium]|nr:Yip1 family protein [Chloroherpetonaceae bacterium]
MKVRELFGRVFTILFRSNVAWKKIHEEPVYDSQDLLRDYALPLIFTTVFFRLAFYGGRYQISLKAVIYTLIAFVILMLSLFVTSSFIHHLSPRFRSTLDRLSATKLSVYGSTPIWVILFFSGTSPATLAGWLFIPIGFVYSLYLFSTGVSIMMNTPKEREAGFLGAISITLVTIYAISFLLLKGASRALLEFPI